MDCGTVITKEISLFNMTVTTPAFIHIKKGGGFGVDIFKHVDKSSGWGGD